MLALLEQAAPLSLLKRTVLGWSMPQAAQHAKRHHAEGIVGMAAVPELGGAAAIHLQWGLATCHHNDLQPGARCWRSPASRWACQQAPLGAHCCRRGWAAAVPGRHDCCAGNEGRARLRPEEPGDGRQQRRRGAPHKGGGLQLCAVDTCTGDGKGRMVAGCQRTGGHCGLLLCRHGRGRGGELGHTRRPWASACLI